MGQPLNPFLIPSFKRVLLVQEVELQWTFMKRSLNYRRTIWHTLLHVFLPIWATTDGSLPKPHSHWPKTISTRIRRLSVRQSLVVAAGQCQCLAITKFALWNTVYRKSISANPRVGARIHLENDMTGVVRPLKRSARLILDQRISAVSRRRHSFNSVSK